MTEKKLTYLLFIKYHYMQSQILFFTHEWLYLYAQLSTRGTISP